MDVSMLDMQSNMGDPPVTKRGGTGGYYRQDSNEEPSRFLQELNTEKQQRNLRNFRNFLKDAKKQVVR